MGDVWHTYMLLLPNTSYGSRLDWVVTFPFTVRVADVLCSRFNLTMTLKLCLASPQKR